MIVIPQDSPEWAKARVGCLTASRLAEAVAKTKTGWGASRANYMAELIAERLTGEAVPSYTNAAMQWGVDKEPDARAAYEFRTDCEVVPAGFVLHQSIPQTGASPDGFIGTDGLLEIKCPNTATHIETLLGGEIAGKYITQMQWQMICTGRKWCDFISYDPRLPETMRLFIRRVPLAPLTETQKLAQDVSDFLKEVDKKVASLNERYNSLKAA